jgi:hypothetical protein
MALVIVLVVVSLITFGGCHYLDGLEQQKSISMSNCLFMAITL